MKIYIKTLTGRTIDLEVDREETVLNVKQKICDQEDDLSPNRIKLIWSGKQLEDYRGGEPKTLRHYDIRKESTLHMVLKKAGATSEKLAKLPSDSSARKAHREWKSKADEFDFDEDLHIVDPQSHFQLLRQLERDVVERSEYFRVDKAYSISSTLEVDLDKQKTFEMFDNIPEVPGWLRDKIIMQIPKWKSLDVAQIHYKRFCHLMRSYCIISRVQESIEEMKSRNFCTNAINILLQHASEKVVEIRRVEVIQVFSLKSCIERNAREILEEMNVISFSTRLADITFFCRSVLEHMGFENCSAENASLNPSLTLIRKTTLLLDSASVSYVRSHGFGFDRPPFESEMSTLQVYDGEDPFAFEGSWTRLACLNAFLDERKVFVFQFLDKNSNNTPPGRDAGAGAHVLARMQDLADIWGPVYAVPSTTGLIKYYSVSKGVICPVKATSRCAALGAVQCHYFSRASFFVQRASKLLSGGEELLLAGDDLLLIGGGLCENQYCKYNISDFTNDYATDIKILGTTDSVWKTETRTVSLSFSGYLGVTVSGTQKLIPQTSLKQHILDKWSTKPSRSNPGILNQYLGVEISHCTGNARRIPLRKLMTLPSIWNTLERQNPGWTRTSWGESTSKALHGDDENAIFRVWNDLSSNRADIAELFCCMLELLDCTGLDENDNFNAAMLYGHDDSAITINNQLNTWSTALRDTHLTSAYVIINEQCLNCNVPNHSTSLCHIPEAYTVLETQFATEKCTRQNDKITYKMEPDGQLWKEVDSGSPDISILGPMSDWSRFVSKPPRVFIELCNRTNRSTRNMVYLRASSKSFHGKRTPKSMTTESEQDSKQGVQRFVGKIFHPTTNHRKKSSSENELIESSNQQRSPRSRESPSHQALALPSLIARKNDSAGSVLTTPDDDSTPMQCRDELKQREQQESVGKIQTRAPSSILHTTRPLIPQDFTIEDDDLIRSDIFGQDINDYFRDA